MTATDFSEALIRERCRYVLRRKDVGRALGILGKDGEALLRRFELGEAVPSKPQFKQIVLLLPRMLAHPPEWPGMVMKFGTMTTDAERAELNREIIEDIRSGRVKELPRRKPLTFGEGLIFAVSEDMGRDGADFQVDDVGGQQGALDKVEAWMADKEPPSDQELEQLQKDYPTLRGLLATGACRRPTPQKETSVHQIQPVSDKPIKSQLAELIKRARVQRERTHRDVANKCNVAQEIVQQWESGEVVPTGREWAKLKGNFFSLGAAQLIWREATREVAETIVNFENLGGGDEVDKIVSSHRVEEKVKEEEVEEQRAEALYDLPKPQGEQEPLPELRQASAEPSFGQALRVARINLGFTQEELGELIDTSATAVSTWETEANMPTADNWRRLVTALPELKDCTPPGLREVRYGSNGSGARFPRARTQDQSMPDFQSIVPRSLTETPGLEAKIAQAGIEYARSLREVTVASEKLRRANEELERLKRAHSAAKTRAEEAQRALVKIVEGE